MSESEKFTARQKHLDWCKKRALEYCDAGDVPNAFASFQSDMKKEESTADHSALPLMAQLYFFTDDMKTPEAMRKFIEGFN